MYKRCTDCEKRGKISEKKKNKQTSNSLIFIQVNSNSFIVIHHIKDFGNQQIISKFAYGTELRHNQDIQPCG